MSTGEKSLQLVEQREVLFYGDALTAVRGDDGHVYVAIRQMCDALGIDAQGQTRRINRHIILAEGFKGVDNLSTPGGPQSAYVLRVDLVPLWLSGIRTSAVKDDIRLRLEQYQREAAKVLWEAFQDGRLTAEPSFAELLESDSPAAQAYRMATAMMRLARQQLLLETQLESHTTILADHEQRLEQVEATLGDPGRHITPEQASQISQAVKAIAMALSQRTGRNEYGGVYGELYRKFGITSYKMLPAHQFEEAMAFLREWHQSLVGDAPF
jgi:hypothetical protein